MKQTKPQQSTSSTAFKVGTICLVFMILGYEVALFVHHSALERVAALRDHPDTVFVPIPAPEVDIPGGVSTLGRVRGGTTSGAQWWDERDARTGPDVSTSGAGAMTGKARHSAVVMEMREKTRRVESFRFDPNTADEQTLQRLGFTMKQAQSIVNYREKGGRFRRKSDFAKSFVVADSVYKRLEPFIDIPLVDINTADSAAFDALPGIGAYFAAKIVSYRRQLGGYSCPEQLMDIRHFDRSKFDALSDLICCSPPGDSFRLWTAPADTLRRHPYIRNWQTARSIVLYRETMPRSEWTPDGLARAGIITDSVALKLGRCLIASY